MEFLPNEITVNILEFIRSIKDIVLFGETCKHFHTIVKAENTRLARKTYGNLSFRGVKKCCLFHVLPSGVLHGRAVLTRENSTFACTVVMGKMHGAFMSISGDVVSTGKYRDGKSVGLFETKRGSVTSEKCLWGDEGGLILKQNRNPSQRPDSPTTTLFHMVSPGWKNVYIELRAFSPFYCQNKNVYMHNYHAKRMKTFVEEKICNSIHRQCCKEHRKGMPKLLF